MAPSLFARVVALSFCLTIACAPDRLGAQVDSAGAGGELGLKLRKGDRVRLTLGDERLNAVFRGLRADSLDYEFGLSPEERQQRTVALPALSRLERRQNHAIAGLIVGALAGGAVGVAFGNLVQNLSENSDAGGSHPSVALGILGSLTGGLIGTGVGIAIPRWRVVYESALRTEVHQER